MTVIPQIPPDVEAQLAGLSAAEWSVFVAKVRAPDATEALRAAAAQLLSGIALEAFVAGADPSKFTDTNGQIDPEKVLANIRAYGRPPAFLVEMCNRLEKERLRG